MKLPVAVIMGLGRGVGVACARKFLEENWAVLVADPDGETIGRAEADLGSQAVVLHDAIHTKLGVHNCLAASLEAFDGVDIVISVPPVPDPRPLLSADLSQVETDLAMSTLASLVAAQVFAPIMISETERERDEAVRDGPARGFIQILSTSSLAGDPDRGVETIAQHASLATMKALALDLAPQGLRANAIAAVRPRAEDEESWLRQRTPLKRSALADEIADAAYFLSTRSASFITGQALVLDGGRSVLNGIMPNGA